jgi:RimJ/RimL family protein N-acetyltransferase
MPDKPVLSNGVTVLRQPYATDVVARLALGRHPEILRMFGVDAAHVGPLTEADVVEWLEIIGKSETAWVIEHAGCFLGEIRLRDVNMTDRNGRLGIGIYDPAWLGKGVGRAAIRLLLPHAFGAMGLHRVSLRVLDINTRAIACYRACGFVEEGRERESAYIGEAWRDDVIMGCLSGEAI